MSRILVMTALVCSLSSNSLFAALRIAIFRTQEAIMETQEAAYERDQLKQELADFQGRMSDVERSIRALEEEYTQNADLLKPSEKLAKQNEAREKLQKFQIEQAKFQEYLQTEEMKRTQRIRGRLAAIVSELAAKEKYDMVLEADAVLYTAGPLVDLTGKVVRLYNERYPAPISKPADSKLTAEKKVSSPKMNTNKGLR